MRHDPSRHLTVTQWEPPGDKIQLQPFLNLAHYYREFIPSHATIITPLKLLQRKNAPYNWDEQAQQAFDTLKSTLVSKDILVPPQPEGRFVLDTDASAVAIAGILHQWQDTKHGRKLCVIAYGSRALRDSERNYGAPRSEMLAVLTFYEKFRSILGDNEFDLRCDAQALRHINTWQQTDHSIAKWMARLSMAKFNYEHRLRDKHQNADSLTKQTQHYHQGKPRPKIATGFAFLSQEDYDKIELLPSDEEHHTTKAHTQTDTQRDTHALHHIREQDTNDPTTSIRPHTPQHKRRTTHRIHTQRKHSRAAPHHEKRREHSNNPSEAPPTDERHSPRPRTRQTRMNNTTR
jgi:hypothetical protein